MSGQRPEIARVSEIARVCGKDGPATRVVGGGNDYGVGCRDLRFLVRARRGSVGACPQGSAMAGDDFGDLADVALFEQTVDVMIATMIPGK
jgi:hypothetical protein